MTDEQRAYWQAYVDALKPIMRLWHWQITVENDPPDDDADAAIWHADDYQTAYMYLAPTWDDKPRDKQREILAHELIHVHLARINVFGKKMAAQLGGQAQGMADEMRLHLLETATEELARVIAPFLPLPPKIKREKQAA